MSRTRSLSRSRSYSFVDFSGIQILINFTFSVTKGYHNSHSFIYQYTYPFPASVNLLFKLDPEVGQLSTSTFRFFIIILTRYLLSHTNVGRKLGLLAWNNSRINSDKSFESIQRFINKYWWPPNIDDLQMLMLNYFCLPCFVGAARRTFLSDPVWCDPLSSCYLLSVLLSSEPRSALCLPEITRKLVLTFLRVGLMFHSRSPSTRTSEQLFLCPLIGLNYT